MSDPLSIASGVAGLISLGLTVCDSLHTYFSAIKDRKDDIAIITQSLSLFKFHIFAVQSSASKLGNRHSPAIDGLQLSLINCEMQLKCLEALLNKLIPTEDPSLAKEIWRRQKLTARYPFDRKKLVQLEEYLSRANVTLSSFIQALNLDINIHMSDELEAYKTSLEALDINTQTTLRTITTRLEVIGPRVEPSALELLPSRIEDVTASSSNSIVLHQAAVSVAETKTSFHGNERSFEDLTKTHSKPRYLQNAELERKLCKELSGMDCTCGASERKTTNRPASRVYRLLGGLTISRQGDVRENHRPGCIFFQKSKRKISKTSLTYFGLLSFFSQSFTVSLTQEYPAGPYSVSFGLQPCNIVESSPAFRLFDTCRSYKIFDRNKIRPDHIAEILIKELRVIYRSGKASPFDVDQQGNNIAHMCLEAYLSYFGYGDTTIPSDIAADATFKMLTYLANIGVPIAASNFNQCNLLTISINSFCNFWILPRLSKLVTNSDFNFCHADIAHGRPLFANMWVNSGEEWARHLNTLCEYPEICEGIGFSELFLAVMKRDYARLQVILAEENNILNISQTDLYERNILHASSNWPDGLRLLLQRQDVRPLMDKSSAILMHFSPLDFALFYSKIYCNAPDQWTDCDDCTCYVSVQLFLEADCNVTIGYKRPETLGGCSLKARKLFFEHLKDRRQRLRNMALAILPEESLHRYGVTTNVLPDKTAPLLWSELQEAKEQRDQLPDVSVSELQNSKKLLQPIFNSKAQCDIPCPCSSGMFSRPLAHILPTMLRQYNSLDSTYFFRTIKEHIKVVIRGIDLLKLPKCSSEELYMAKCSIHILTMMSLGVRHLPICLSEGYCNLWNPEFEEDWKEMLDEDQDLIRQLEALDEELGEAFNHQNVPIGEFLWGHWLPRMEEVIEDLNKPLANVDRYSLLEAGVSLQEADYDIFGLLQELNAFLSEEAGDDS
ncbi:hypothetical protein FOC1_g10006201 [Fusarium oxysporum f. sp. cubense race 1]|uniref:Fungal N-terminal domain-containing protein n=1 Tax=Fusarium oxysporum f. sp. cubense (strain race 1) TaxID=1229664 RepID=N4U633_FUSC1|nr:hypothetical protein FOC1_g10006201 [Fusarium oxysporum f. sp. cubense race 1]